MNIALKCFRIRTDAFVFEDPQTYTVVFATENHLIRSTVD